MARPFHFTTDTTTSFDEEQDGTDATWTVNTASSIVSVTGGSADSRWVRKTDASTNSTVQMRTKSASAAPFGIFANWQSGTQFYLAYLRSGGTFQLFVKNGGYTVLASKAYATSNGTYYKIKLTTVTNGANKDLEGFVDGVSELTASTATLFGSGRMGMMANAVGQVDFDWFAPDTSITVTSISPSSGIDNGGDPVVIVGTDFGDGALPYIDTTVCTGITVTPTTSIVATTPAGTAGVVNVVVKFGTSGSEEYTGTLTSGYTYLANWGAGSPSIVSLIAESRHSVFRRLHIKRRMTGGEYESSWQAVPAQYIKSWGRVKNATDNLIVGEYQQSGVQLRFRNDDAYFNDENDLDSNWYGYYTRYRTLVRVQAGYYDISLNEYPSDTTIFIGIINTDFDKTSQNEITIQVDSLDSIFKEIPASSIVFPGITTTAQRADQLIDAIKNFTDGSNNLVFQKFIASADWTITTGTVTYPGLNTTTVFKSETAWSVIQKLAQAENKVAYISPTGKFNFVDRPTTTASLSYELKGLGAGHTAYGHNIISVDSLTEAVSKVYNRVRVKYAEADTETSYYTKSQSWSWGDGSTSDKYGVRTYNLDNQWLGNGTQAQAVGDAIFNAFSVLRDESHVSCKFLPHIFLGNVSLVTFQDTLQGDNVLWGQFLWGYADWSVNTETGGIRINERFQILGVEHDLDNFKTIFHLRTEA